MAQGRLEIGCIVTARLAATTKAYTLFDRYQELTLFCKFIYTCMLLTDCLMIANYDRVESRLPQIV